MERQFVVVFLDKNARGGSAVGPFSRKNAEVYKARCESGSPNIDSRRRILIVEFGSEEYWKGV